jgi:hypothetical protein
MELVRMTTTTKKEKALKEARKNNPKLDAFLKEQEAKKKAEAERIANLKGFDKLIHETELKAKEANNRVKEIEAELAKAKDAEKEILKEIQHMKVVQKMAGWETNNSMKWYKEAGTAYREQAWKYYWKLKTATLDLYITVVERTDMKKFKYEVSVSGHRNSFQGGENGFNGGIYRDNDAITKVNHTWGEMETANGRTTWTYILNEGAPESTKKFSKLEDAEAFAKEWMKLIDNHYKAELKKDRAMLKEALKTQKPAK